MALPNTPSKESQQYSVVLSSSTYANSPEGALGMFFAQMATGHVCAEIHNADTGEAHDLDEILDANARDQIDLGISLIKRHVGLLSAHERMELLSTIATSAAEI